jgi:glycosyltransferase involved in cell wall biosynthesis
MVLSRHPYAEQSGRAAMLRQRIEQARLRFDPHIVVIGARAGDGRDEGLHFLPMANPAAIALNLARLSRLPMQTWLYHSADARTRIAQMAGETGAVAVYVDMLRLAPLAREASARAALIIDFDDLLSERYRQAAGQDYDVMGFLAQRMGPLARVARLLASPLLEAESERCAAYERDLLGRAELALFTSPREAASVAHMGAHVMAGPPLTAAHANAPAPGRRLIFLGNMRYAENAVMVRALARAADSLAAEGALPDDALIEVVGDHAPGLAAEFDARRFRFLGRVQDLGALAGAGVFLAPVASGSGVKLKVLDGMALGCPVVATAKACEGLAVRPNRDLIVARDAADVLRIALALRDRERLKAMLAKRSRRYIETHHAPAIGERVAEAMLAAVARARQETL